MVTAQWIMHRSNSVFFCMHIVTDVDVATDLIRICKMQLFFWLDKRPGESHLALDGKDEPTGVSTGAKKRKLQLLDVGHGAMTSM